MHRSYRDAVIVGAVLQTVILTLVVFCPSGRFALIALICALAFWASVLILIARNPGNPKELDLIYIRYGTIVVSLLGHFLITFIWKLGGVW